MGQIDSEDDVRIRRKRTSSLQCHASIVQRSAQKQRRGEIPDTLLCRFGNDKHCFSHNYFCRSAQSLWSMKHVKICHVEIERFVVTGQF